MTLYCTVTPRWGPRCTSGPARRCSLRGSQQSATRLTGTSTLTATSTTIDTGTGKTTGTGTGTGTGRNKYKSIHSEYRYMYRYVYRYKYKNRQVGQALALTLDTAPTLALMLPVRLFSVPGTTVVLLRMPPGTARTERTRVEKDWQERREEEVEEE